MDSTDRHRLDASTTIMNAMPVDPLTAREQQIADAIVRGLSNKQIGRELGISPETVKRHLASIYAKLAIRGRVALAVHILRSRAA